MADIADTASELAQRFSDSAVANRQTYSGKSSEFCQDCGDPIPEKRRKSILGCTRCVPCQDFFNYMSARRAVSGRRG